MQHSQRFLPMGNKSHSAPISIFMAKIDESKYKEILHPGGLITGNIHNISSCIEYRYYKEVQFIKSRKYLVSVLYNKCLPFPTHHDVPCLHFISYSDDALYLYQKSPLVVMICLTCTAYPCLYTHRVHIDKKK